MTFGKWLWKEMEDRGWSQADLTRQSKISKSMISLVINDKSQPGPDFCTAIAGAFNYPPDLVFRKAGLLPPLTEDPPGAGELLHLYRQSSEDTRAEILEFARFKSRR